MQETLYFSIGLRQESALQDKREKESEGTGLPFVPAAPNLQTFDKSNAPEDEE